MTNEKIIVANLKCNGCANTIKNNISSISGVLKVEIDPDHNSVDLEYEDTVDRSTIISTLKKLGYPEATEENGLLTQLKSYASCMVGRMTAD